MLDVLPPGLLMMMGSLLLLVLGRPARPFAFLAVGALVLLYMTGLEPGDRLTMPLATYELVPLEVDRLSLLFGYVFGVTVLVGGIYALHVDDVGQQVSALLYAGSSLGAVFAGDLFTLVVFWEVMALTSAYLIWARRTTESYRAAMRYLFVHLVGGSLLLAGVIWHVSNTGSLEFTPFAEPGVASVLILLGFLVNAGAVPFHAWVGDAYPRGTITGSVFLSAFTTKVALYVLAHAYAGWPILIWVGTLMAVWGVTYALLSNDMRRILSYHIVSQVGFMVVAVGVGTAMGINGAASHAVTNILNKGTLFMACGAVMYAAGTPKLSELGGLFRKMPWTFALYVVPALGISGVPLFSGFISKGMAVDSAAYGPEVTTAVLLLHLASVGTFLSVGLKLPWFTWFGEAKRDIEVKPLPRGMLVAMGIAAVLNIALGVRPELLYGALPFSTADYDLWSAAHLSKAVQLVIFAGIGYFLFLTVLKPKAKIQLDLDWFYRRPRVWVWQNVVAPVGAGFGAAERAAYRLVHAVARISARPIATAWSLLGHDVRVERAAEPIRTPGGFRDDPNAYRMQLGVMAVVAVVVVLAAGVLILFGGG